MPEFFVLRELMITAGMIQRRDNLYTKSRNKIFYWESKRISTESQKNNYMKLRVKVISILLMNRIFTVKRVSIKQIVLIFLTKLIFQKKNHYFQVMKYFNYLIFIKIINFKLLQWQIIVKLLFLKNFKYIIFHIDRKIFSKWPLLKQALKFLTIDNLRHRD